MNRILLFILLLPAAVSPDLAADRAALLDLRHAVRGRTLLWNTSDLNPCNWIGVECDESTDRVISLRLPGKELSGYLPENTIGKMTELRVLSLRENSLSGRIPDDLGSCVLLRELHLQGNRFAGEIPGSLFGLRNLVGFNVARNGLSGNFPAAFGNLTMLRILLLESNQFTGALPDLGSLVRLRRFNVSFNLMNGSIPSSLARFSGDSFIGTSLCGAPLLPCAAGKHLSRAEVAGIIIGSGFFVLFCLLLIIFLLWRNCRNREISPILHTPPFSQSPVSVTPPREEAAILDQISVTKNQNFPNRMKVVYTEPKGIVFFGEDVQMFSLDELLNSSAEVIGKGTVGSTYKAFYDGGGEVIVKRVKNICVSEEVFRSRIEEFGSLVHENLYPFKGYYYSRDEKLLFFDQIHNGSLSAHIHGNKNPLKWGIRAQIAAGAASGIQYLHSISPHTVHGNIKSSNIFIAGNYNALVSEHGLISLVAPRAKSNAYRAPEVVESGVITQKSDVYSFGIVLLELVTGKSPEKAEKEGGTLVEWVRSAVEEERAIGALDPELVRLDSEFENKCRPFLELAILCASGEVYRRPSMAEVAQRFHEINF